MFVSWTGQHFIQCQFQILGAKDLCKAIALCNLASCLVAERTTVLQVVLSSQNGSNSTTITSSNGTFSFPVDSTRLLNASVTIPVSQANSSQLILSNGTVYNCSDTATNQAPAFTLSALVPQNGTQSPLLNQVFLIKRGGPHSTCSC